MARRLIRAASVALAFMAHLVIAHPVVAASLERGDIVDRLIGQPIQWSDFGSEIRGELYLAPDGSAEIRMALPLPSADVGTWRVEGSRLCTRWQVARGGIEKCYAIDEIGPGRFTTTGGNLFEIRSPEV